MANGAIECEIIETIPEIDNSSIAIKADKHPSLKRAWSSNTRTISKLVRAACIIGCVLGTLSFALSGLSFMRASTKSGVVSLLFGDAEFSEYDYENGILPKLIDKLETNQKTVQELVQWANGSSCIPGSGFKYKNHCYRFGERAVKYEIAQLYCNLRGGWVMFFEDEGEMMSVLDYLWGLGYDRVNELWMGLKLVDGKWKYSNGGMANYVKWARGNIFDEGFNCAQLRTEQGEDRAGVYDRRCIDVKDFMCKFETDIKHN